MLYEIHIAFTLPGAHHHQTLLPPVAHTAATMSLFHRVLSFAIACASPHDKPISLSSVSTVFLQVGLSLPLFNLGNIYYFPSCSGGPMSLLHFLLDIWKPEKAWNARGKF